MRLPENNPPITIVQRMTELSNRRANTLAFEVEPGAGWDELGSMAKRLDSSKPAMPAVILLDRAVELGFAEIRPQRLGDHQFGIADLPKQKVAHAHLTTGPNEQIGVRNIARVKVL